MVCVVSDQAIPEFHMCKKFRSECATLLGASERASHSMEFHMQYPLLGLYVCGPPQTNVEQKADPVGIYILYFLDRCVLSQWGQSVDSAVNECRLI